MEELIKFLNENKMGFLATVENGEPRVRPWEFIFEDGGKFFFATDNTKDVYKQLKTTPFVEFSSSSSQFGWIRLRGAIKFSVDLAIKEKVLKSEPMIETLYKTANNPIYEVFYIEHGTATMAKMSEPPSKNFKF